ncbi:transposase [Roseomonas sp. KE2513]|uniref:ISNCY family transposase n=1 Tax=Roseomonas sp. KE2513 TaxID=2479202 RepID=UPI0018E05548|nr:ISNCY family transposase [Roseomonas sp. KE2513]MBI0538223.1 transposase [Roseomonas sp. KE2513]
MRRVSMATRDELAAVTAERYARAGRGERRRILDEFTAVTGFHRRHATRLLRSGLPPRAGGPRPGQRVYDDAVREALVVLWEASDRVCGKRLQPLVPVLVEAMERHGHLQLAPEVRGSLLAMSAATMDRALRQARDGAAGRRRRRMAPSAAVRRSVPVRTFSDWDDPAPGYVEADLVAHSGPTAKGSFVQTLVLTDIATGWTECAPLLVREQGRLVEVLGELRKRMPFALLGFDTDNDGMFMNETVRDYCAAAGVEFTRCRPYRKNDQAWVEQKNGAVVRRIVGYRRYEGVEAAAALAQFYGAVQLFVNFFQPSFKLAEKAREGARVRKRYHPPATPYQRLVADPRSGEEVRLRVAALHAMLDPVGLLRTIRTMQKRLVEIADWPVAGERAKPTAPNLEAFLSGLRTAWQEGEVRPTARPKEKAERLRRRPDPFATVTALLQGWFAAEPWRTSRELLERLQAEQSGGFPAKQLQTLQRRLKAWRRDEAHRLVFGTVATEEEAKGDAARGSGL